MGRSWFSIETTSHLKGNSPRMSFPYSRSSPVDSTDVEVTEIKERENLPPQKIVDKEPVTCKSLRFRLFPTAEEKEKLKQYAEQHRWTWNMCKNVLEKNNSIKSLKDRVDDEKEKMVLYRARILQCKQCLSEAMKAHSNDSTPESEDNVKQLEGQLKEIKRSNPRVKFRYETFRDQVGRYKFTAEDSQSNVVLVDFVEKEPTEKCKIELPDGWWKHHHNRVPRGAVHEFVGALNSSISNYRNSGRDFSINFKRKKNRNTIHFEDGLFPSWINEMRNRYGYTAVLPDENGRRRRRSITLKEIKKHTKVQSIRIVHEQDIDRYYLYLPVPTGFYLPDDRHRESQALLVPKEEIISLDPGVRTFAMGYTPTKTVSMGDEGAVRIFELLNEYDDLWVGKEASPEAREKASISRREKMGKIRYMIEDLHWKVIKYLVSNYKTIVYTDFRTKGMMKKLSKENKRKLQALSFFKFKQRLIYKCKTSGVDLVIINESYTSLTCGKCGHQNPKNRSKTFKCHECGWVVDRDCNGARNIMLKALGFLCP